MDDLEALSESMFVPKTQNNDCHFIDVIQFLIVVFMPVELIQSITLQLCV